MRTITGYPLWKSYLVLVSLWTDPVYVAHRATRLLRRFTRASLRSSHSENGSTAWSAHKRNAEVDGRARIPPNPEQLEVDLVYTWVNGSDPVHRDKRNHWLERYGLNPAIANPNERYIEADELRYSMRSAEQFLPWVRHVFIVTDAQIPGWLDVNHPRVTVVDHRQIATHPEELPTFNSKAIFGQLHNIPGLSEHFIVADDDTFFGQPCTAGDFFGYLPSNPSAVMKVMPSESDSDWIVPAHQVTNDPLAQLWMAGWNNVKLLLERRRPWKKVRRMDLHQAYGMTRTALARTAARYPVEYARLCRSKFRMPDDVHLSALVRYGALYDGEAIRGSVTSRVFRTERELSKLNAVSLPKLFCVNGGSADSVDQDRRELERLYPARSAFERESE